MRQLGRWAHNVNVHRVQIYLVTKVKDGSMHAMSIIVLDYIFLRFANSSLGFIQYSLHPLYKLYYLL